MKPSEGNAEQSGMRTAVTLGTARDRLVKRARVERRKRMAGAMVWDEAGFFGLGNVKNERCQELITSNCLLDDECRHIGIHHLLIYCHFAAALKQ
jgi:hypothetical protein